MQLEAIEKQLYSIVVLSLIVKNILVLKYSFTAIDCINIAMKTS